MINKRILVIGCPGSGKSYFSKELSKILNIEVIHIDNLYWNKDKTHITREELIKELDKVLKSDSYILDGNYVSTLEYRLGFVDTVFFLDFPKSVCVKGIEERTGYKRNDLPWIESKEDGEELIEFVNNFSKDVKPRILELLGKYPNLKIITFKNREEANQYLLTLK